MEIQLIFNVMTFILLMIVIVILLVGRKKGESSEVAILLKQASNEQREQVQKQIALGSTEQFERFSVMGESVQKTLMSSREETSRHLQEFKDQMEKRWSDIQKSNIDYNEQIRENVTKTLQNNRKETNEQLDQFSTRLDMRLSDISEQTQLTLKESRTETNQQLSTFREKIDDRLSNIEQGSLKSNEKMTLSVTTTLQETRVETNERLSKFQTQLDTRLSATAEQTQTTLRENRTETNGQLSEFRKQVDARLSEVQKQNTSTIEKVNTTLENKMQSLQESNEKRLEQMQGVVDEKLQKTLETRLTQSFETVGKHLESVQQGLGEMKTLAEDAKSLKHALTNVKDRGTYGEVRLERLLEDILAPSQYEKNANISDGKVVEFVIKLPGNDDTPLWLPIDAKFPIEDYNRLMVAEEKSEIEAARKSLLQSIKRFAMDISQKYIYPPKTTNFALMFLPTEGLYAEVIRDAALFEELREKHKVIVVGATTLSAFLGSLQIGFKTLAIEKYSQEVWETLGKVKGEFKKFEGVLNTAHKQIKTAEGTLEKLSGTRMRAIDRALRGVEEMGMLEDGGSDVLLDVTGTDGV